MRPVGASRAVEVGRADHGDMLADRHRHAQLVVIVEGVGDQLARRLVQQRVDGDRVDCPAGVEVQLQAAGRFRRAAREGYAGRQLAPGSVGHHRAIIAQDQAAEQPSLGSGLVQGKGLPIGREARLQAAGEVQRDHQVACRGGGWGGEGEAMFDPLRLVEIPLAARVIPAVFHLCAVHAADRFGRWRLLPGPGGAIAAQLQLEAPVLPGLAGTGLQTAWSKVERDEVDAVRGAVDAARGFPGRWVFRLADIALDAPPGLGAQSVRDPQFLRSPQFVRGNRPGGWRARGGGCRRKRRQGKLPLG